MSDSLRMDWSLCFAGLCSHSSFPLHSHMVPFLVLPSFLTVPVPVFPQPGAVALQRGPAQLARPAE